MTTRDDSQIESSDSSDSFACENVWRQLRWRRQRAKVKPMTITTPFRSAIEEPRLSPFKNLSKAFAAAYIEWTIRDTNPSPTVLCWAHNLLSEATQGKASAVADKQLPNHWAKDFWLRV